MMTVRLGTLFVIFKLLSCGLAEESPCTPGFESKLLVFKVHKDHLHRGERLGRVIFNTCDGRTGIHFQSTDQGIDLSMDGTLMLTRSVTLHEGLKEFSVSAWDSSGKKHTASVRVEHVRYHEDPDMESPSDDLALTFPKSSMGLKRAKRGWIIPPITVPENSRGPFPMRLARISSDHASETRMSYKITGEGADQDPKGIFTIDRLSGWVSVTQPLDREKKAFYELVAHATGVDVNIVEKPMEIIISVIDQNDNKPVFIQNPFNGNVPEAAEKGKVFMMVTATDADDKVNTNNADISYSIVSQDPPSPKPKMFAINPASGAISVLETGLDRKQWSRYTLVIMATDMNGEGGSTTGTAVITVLVGNDKTPQRGWIIPPISVPENSKGPFPMKLLQIRSDYASETRLAYKITGEGADLDPKGIFTIDRLSGWVSVTQQLDREKKSSYKLVAHATGVDADIVEKPVEIIVTVTDQNDNRPVFTQNPFHGNVRKTAGKGEVFMTVTATDADDKENTDNADISYSIVSQFPPSPKPNMFAINPVSGAISVLETGLDRKQWSIYTLAIKAADMNGEGLSTTATAVITVTDSKDNTPLFGKGWIIPPVSVTENSKGPFPVRLVQIKSVSASETQMAYRITGEGADQDPKGIFQIDRLSGWISVTQQLDRDNKDSYRLVAHANSVDGRTAEKPVEIVVNVIDQNDNKPVFTQNHFNGSVHEAAEKGEVFMTVIATDADDKENTDNADIRYSIVSQDPPSPKPNMFAINPVSGGISVLETGLDRKQWSSYTLVIKAADKNGEGLSTTATAVITVTDSKDNTPQFERGWIIPPINVLENSKGPFPERLVQIRSAYASEIQMSYKITGEGADLDPKGIFTIDRLSGWVSVTQPLDRENKDSYKLVAHATGVDVNIVEKPMEIVVTVTDQNDNKPVFTQNIFSGNVPEALERGEVFLTVTATDADDKDNTDNADISYSIVSQDPPSPKPNMFAINPVSGAISVLETGLDRKQWSRYTLFIKAADMNGEGLSTTATAVITVTDAVV